jgi:NhaP-type Na+/H+ or K+/H+ antiporter
MWGIAAIGFAVLAFSLVSGRLKGSYVTLPMVFILFGLVVGNGGLQLIDAPVSHGAIHVLAEITLALILFSDAARIDLRLLLSDHDLPARMLAIGMPLTIALGTFVGWVLPLGLGLAEAALLAAVLAPTDAALGQSVVSNRQVPVRIRQALNVESGLNDGIAVPFVYFFAAFLVVGEHAKSTYDLVSFTALQLAFGPIVGLIVGGVAGWLAKRAGTDGWMDDVFEGPLALATAALAYALAQATGGNGFISVFVAGLVFGHMLEGKCKFILEFAEAEGHVLVLLAFLIFGAVMVPGMIADVNWIMVLYAFLSLTIIRLLPIAISLVGTGVSLPTVVFLGWFGPRGLASILFGLLVLEQLQSAGGKTILATTVVTIVLSVFAHGLTAAPLARWYARMARNQGACPENMPVSEMPTRFGNAPTAN